MQVVAAFDALLCTFDALSLVFFVFHLPTTILIDAQIGKHKSLKLQSARVGFSAA